MLIDYKKVNIYQDERQILKDVDFQAGQGEFIYLIGRVGSGKSSLLKTFYGELDIDSEDAEKDFQLLHDRSVAKNLKFVLQATGWNDRKKISRRIEEVLEQVGMTDKKDKMPSELSGGEQQRVAIARALLNTPKIILADEPTGNLDPETAANIVSILKDTCQTGTTVIMSTHNISLLDRFPGKVYRCKDGGLSRLTDKHEACDLDEETTPIEPIIEPAQDE